MKSAIVPSQVICSRGSFKLTFWPLTQEFFLHNSMFRFVSIEIASKRKAFIAIATSVPTGVSFKMSTAKNSQQEQRASK